MLFFLPPWMWNPTCFTMAVPWSYFDWVGSLIFPKSLATLSTEHSWMHGSPCVSNQFWRDLTKNLIFFSSILDTIVFIVWPWCFVFFFKITHSNQAFIFKTKKRLIEPSNPNRYHATHRTHEYTKNDKFVVQTFFIVLMLLKVPKKMKLSAKGLGNSPPNKGL